MYQRPLFREASLQDVWGSRKVIPIPTLTPVQPNQKRRARSEPAASRRTPRASGSSSVDRRAADLQQTLDFHGAPANAGTLGTQVEAVIYCDAKVAVPAHRAMAVAVDASMVLIGMGLILAVFFLSGGDIVLSKNNVPFLLGAALGVALFYKSLWYMANADTPGLHFAGLRLVDFDGRAPRREQRRLRQMAGVLSLVSVGLGLIWALVDEEGLTWHDHISKTFPTADR